MARKVSFENQEIHDKLIEAIKCGAPHALACMFAGVSRRAFYRWMQFGRAVLAKMEDKAEVTDKDEQYLEFYMKIKQAEAEMDLSTLRLIKRAAEDGSPKDSNAHWHAAAWLEERRHPEWFALTNRFEHSGPGGGPIVSDTPTERVEKLTDDILRKLQARRGDKQLDIGDGADDGGSNGSHLRGNGSG
jgi:hypothetical protein